MYREDLKFSLWADFIERDYLDGEFKELIESKTINGATSNPAIFKNAILNSPAYKEQLSGLDALGAKEKYETLALYDIKKAAQILLPLYEAGDDGYVSIEVDPFLSSDATATIQEGKRLHASIGLPNVMIKVPATEAGYIAMEALVSEGIAVNATLIFKKEQAISCANAFAKGVKKFGTKVDTVISIFVSRVDRAIDDELASADIEVSLTGIYNSADIYETIMEMDVLGCRTLFASTGVKGDTLPAHYYIEKLLAYNSVNTAPIDTIKAYVEIGKTQEALPISASVIEAHMHKVQEAGIDLEEVLNTQIQDGLEAFEEAFKEILENL